MALTELLVYYNIGSLLRFLQILADMNITNEQEKLEEELRVELNHSIPKTVCNKSTFLNPLSHNDDLLVYQHPLTLCGELIPVSENGLSLYQGHHFFVWHC